jgi:hypothetical protein
MSASNNSVKWFIRYEDSTGYERIIVKNPDDYLDAIASLRHLKSRDLHIIETNVL